MGETTQFQPDFGIRTAEQDPTGRAEPMTRIVDPEQARHMAKKGNALRTKQAIALLISKSAWQIDAIKPYSQTKPFVPVIRKRSTSWRTQFANMVPDPPANRTEPIYSWHDIGYVANKVFENVTKSVMPIGRYVTLQHIEALTVAEQADEIAQSYGTRASVAEDEAGRKYVANTIERDAAIVAHEFRRAAVNEQLSY